MTAQMPLSPAKPASRGGERRVRSLVAITQRVTSFGLRHRWLELDLLLAPAAIALVGSWILSGPRYLFSPGLLAALAYALLLVAANVGLSWLAPWADQRFFPLAAFLLVVGFVFATAAYPAEVWLHLTSRVFGLAVMLGTPLVLARIERARAGREPGEGSAGIAGRLSHVGREWSRPAQRRRLVVPALLVAALASAAVAGYEIDLGAGLVTLMTLVAPVYAAGGRGWLCAAAVAAGAALDAGSVALASPDGWVALSPASARSHLALDAVAHGAVFGVGLTQAQLVRAGSFWRVAAIAEATGLAGLGAVLCAYAALVARGLRVAVIQRHHGLRLLAVAACAALAAQAMVATAEDLALLPPSDVPAPLLAAPSPANLLNMILIGFLLFASGNITAAPGHRPRFAPAARAGKPAPEVEP